MTAALLAVGLGCGGTVSVYAHPPELESSLLDAINRIEAATGVEVDYSGGSGAVEFRHGQVPGHGQWNPVTRKVTLTPALSAVGRDVVVLHELMHVLGAEHIAAGAGVMTPTPAGPLKLTVADLEELCDHVECTRLIPEESRLRATSWAGRELSREAR